MRCPSLPARRSGARAAPALYVAASLAWSASAGAQPPAAAPMLSGLDHVPIAVTDLERAGERYRALGFSLKPGRPHANGIRSLHVKFPDGTELELLTAPAARDALTAEYRRLLAAGEGPAFVGLYASDLAAVARRLASAGKLHRRAGGLVTFPEGDPLRHVFFGGRNRSPTDRPEHFAHPNGAESLVGVWLAGDDLASERALLEGLGVAFAEREQPVPGVERAPVGRLGEGEVVLLPGSWQQVSGRRVVGVTLATRDLDAARLVLAEAGLGSPAVVEAAGWRSVVLPPGLTHGLWLELRESRGR